MAKRKPTTPATRRRTKGKTAKRKAAELPIEPPKLLDPEPRSFGPQGLASCYVIGDTMEPRFSIGEMLFIEKTRPPRVGDDVLVDVRSERGGYSTVARLVERTSAGLKLKRFNPSYTFDLEAHRVVQTYRVMTAEDMFERLRRSS